MEYTDKVLEHFLNPRKAGQRPAEIREIAHYKNDDKKTERTKLTKIRKNLKKILPFGSGRTDRIPS